VPELPSVLDRFAAKLTNSGFSITRDETDRGHFGDRLLELADERTRIRLTSDRGLWTIEVGVGSCWRSPYTVILALDGAKYARRALSHDERVRYAGEAMARLPATADELAVLNASIDALNREAWEDQFGRS
jgi:hypothetical protein